MQISNFLNATSNPYLNNPTRFLETSVSSTWSAIILATGLTSLAGLAVYHWKTNDRDALITDFDKATKEKVASAYGYVFKGFVLTSIASTIAHVSGLSFQLLKHSYALIPLTLVSIGSLIATQWTNKENTAKKLLSWGIFNASMGIALSPIGFINKAIVAQAGAISLGLGGLLTGIVYLSPNTNFMKWEGPLWAGFASLSIASAAALFFPNTAFAYGADRASLYGGLVIFCGFLMASTQRLIKEAESKRKNQFDPINSSLGIYLDILNIFVKILKILAENKKEEAKA